MTLKEHSEIVNYRAALLRSQKVKLNNPGFKFQLSCSSEPSVQSVLPSHLRFKSTQWPAAQVNSSSEQNEKVMIFVVCLLSGHRFESLINVHVVVPRI